MFMTQLSAPRRKGNTLKGIGEEKTLPKAQKDGRIDFFYIKLRHFQIVRQIIGLYNHYL